MGRRWNKPAESRFVTEVLDNQMSWKGTLRWCGPYAVVVRHPSGAYIVQELDGAVLKQPVAWKRLKSYVLQQGLELAVLAPKWISPIDEIEEDLLRDDSNELKFMITHVNAGRANILHLQKPWLLKGIAVEEYWDRVYQQWIDQEAQKRAGLPIKPDNRRNGILELL